MSQFIEMFGGDKYHQMELDSIAEVWLKGQAFKKDNICEEGTIFCIHYGELFTKYGPIIYDVSSTTNDEIMKASKSGDILFPASDVTPDGLARCSAIMRDEVLLGGDIIVLRPKQGNNPEYLSWAINMQKEQLLKRVTGSVVRHMSAKGLKTVQIPIAPIDKQKQFIKIVKQADKSGFDGRKSQFIEMFKDELNHKSLCNICRPKQWPTIQTKDFTEDGYLVYGANGVIGHYSDYNHEFPTILMACRGASCGAINVSEPRSYITGNAMCLDDLSDEISFEFLVHFLSYYDYRTIITGGAQPQITFSSLQKVSVPIPSKEKQKLFVEIARQADKSGFELRKSIDAIDAVIKSLINS